MNSHVKTKIYAIVECPSAYMHVAIIYVF